MRRGRRREPAEEAREDPLTLMRRAIDTIFAQRSEFKACWTYITARKPA